MAPAIDFCRRRSPFVGLSCDTSLESLLIDETSFLPDDGHALRVSYGRGDALCIAERLELTEH